MEKMRRKYSGRVEQGSPLPLGVTIESGKVNFSFPVEEGRIGKLLLYNKTDKVIEEVVLPCNQRTGDVKAIRLPNLEVDKYEYNYEIDEEIIVDPYVKEVRGREQFGEKSSADFLRGVIKSKQLRWEEDSPLQISYENSIIYKLHVRGFTMQKNSKVRHKGSFRGLAEKIPYLKELGITAIELMPAYEFEENSKEDVEGKVNYWGYANGYYYAPKQAYCSTKDGKLEFQKMVQEFHKNGIEVIMEFYFGEPEKASMVLDVLHYWMLEYHIDGFHLLGEGTPVNLVMEDPLLKRSKLWIPQVDAGWIFGEKIPLRREIAEYNMSFENDMRRLLKGDENMLSTLVYYARRNPKAHGIINFLANNDGYTMADMVSYERKNNLDNGEENKDGNDYNQSWNCGVEGVTRKPAVRLLRMKQLKNAFLLLLLSQGTPLIYAGDEFGNSQGGNNNAYCQDNPIGWTDWSVFRKNQELQDFVCKVIKFRKQHPILHMEKELRIMDYKANGYPDLSYHSSRAWYAKMDSNSYHLGMMYCGLYAKDEDEKVDDFIYVAYNFHWEPHEFALPKLPIKMNWYEAINTSNQESSEAEKISNQKIITVEPRTVAVLIGR